eukprot:COSAG02_NODE_17415_length_1005_cov_4.268212_2_plen_78_part_01
MRERHTLCGLNMDVEQPQCDSQVWGRWNDTHTSVTSPADRAGGSEGKNTSVPASAKVRFTSNWQSKRPVLPVDSQSLR